MHTTMTSKFSMFVGAVHSVLDSYNNDVKDPEVTVAERVIKRFGIFCGYQTVTQRRCSEHMLLGKRCALDLLNAGVPHLQERKTKRSVSAKLIKQQMYGAVRVCPKEKR